MASQSIKGKCPACGGNTLFVGEGGRITCSLDKCPDPAVVDKLLSTDIIILKRPIQKSIVMIDER